MRTFLAVLFGLVVCGTAISQQAVQRPVNETPYDEWAESPTVFLAGCGEFPAVRVTIAGQELENRGIIRQGRTYLPARETLERLGGTVAWSQQERAFYGQFPEYRITFRVAVGSNTARVFQYDTAAPFGAGRFTETLRLDAAPMQCEGRVYAPIRAAVRAIGGTIHYDARTRMVYVYPPPSAAGQAGVAL